ncbi:MAG: hydroxymethylpyrimidine/phosphomethylpyrimidine kinase [Clostridiales Family XIII bacterium]|jgi:hydroxymethylpyrimidine/phosphomethylpyrimidine kinase|nr:hydroxymethylpyrimidine/phosphomethylpyrimidine kinase [Clostridiales Family XIII bacterium]
MKSVLTIAGSDPSGGAGIQADIKTITVHGVYATSAITAITVQNTLGVTASYPVPATVIKEQIEAIVTDIRPDAIKIGMLPNVETVHAVCDCIEKYELANVVVDPVMVSTSGHKLNDETILDVMLDRLFPLVSVLTPNITEAETLADAVFSNIAIQNFSDMQSAANSLREGILLYDQMEKEGPYAGIIVTELEDDEPLPEVGDIIELDRGVPAILIKGGHLTDCSDDLLYDGDKYYRLQSKRIDNDNTHGTGCTLSSAIACNLALGYDVLESVGHAKRYIMGAIKDGLDLGQGNGPLNHMYDLDLL